MDTALSILLGILIVVVVWLSFQSKECFGQDASIRASVGGLAGPAGLYGFDPIDVFARQIEAERQIYFAKHGRNPPE